MPSSIAMGNTKRCHNDHQQARRLHELTTDQQDDVDDDQEHDRAQSQPTSIAEAAIGLWDLLIGQDVLEDQGAGDNEQSR